VPKIAKSYENWSKLRSKYYWCFFSGHSVQMQTTCSDHKKYFVSSSWIYFPCSFLFWLATFVVFETMFFLVCVLTTMCAIFEGVKMSSWLLHSFKVVSGLASHSLVCGACSLKRKHNEGINTDCTGNKFHILSNIISFISINYVTVKSIKCRRGCSGINCELTEHLLRHCNCGCSNTSQLSTSPLWSL